MDSTIRFGFMYLQLRDSQCKQRGPDADADKARSAARISNMFSLLPVELFIHLGCFVFGGIGRRAVRLRSDVTGPDGARPVGRLFP